MGEPVFVFDDELFLTPAPKTHQQRRSAMHGFASVIETYAEHLVSKGRLPQRDYKLSALALVGAANELVVEHLTAENAPSVEQIADELVLTFRAIIRGASLEKTSSSA